MNEKIAEKKKKKRYGSYDMIMPENRSHQLYRPGASLQQRMIRACFALSVFCRSGGNIFYGEHDVHALGGVGGIRHGLSSSIQVSGLSLRREALRRPPPR